MKKSELPTLLEIYKTAVEMADRVSQRRQSANSFYLSASTAILAASSFIKSDFLLSIAGLLTCILWMQNIRSYKDLNAGKFEVIHELEKQLPFGLFSKEWDYLERGQNKSKYRPFHSVEILVPWIFIAVYIVVILQNKDFQDFVELAVLLLRSI